MKNKKTFSFLVFSSIVASIPIVGFTTNKLLNSIQKEQVPKIITPSSHKISETYEINEGIGPLDIATWSKVGDKPLLRYIDNQGKDLLFPFAKDKNGNIMENTIELDLNVWKPLGMEDDIFLKNLRFSLSNNFLKTKIDNPSSKLFKYNIVKKNYPENSKIPSLKNIENYKNLLPKEIGKMDEKLVFNLFDYKDLNGFGAYQDEDKSFAFIVFEIIHDQDTKNNNNINRVLITPKLKYNIKAPKDDWTTNIPTTKFDISFISDFFNYSPILQTGVDWYLSDSKRLNIYTFKDEDSTSIVNNIKINTEIGKNGIILSPNEPIEGRKIPSLEIDTSNFYLNSDDKHKNTKYKVSVEGFKIPELKFKIGAKDFIVIDFHLRYIF